MARAPPQPGCLTICSDYRAPDHGGIAAPPGKLKRVPLDYPQPSALACIASEAENDFVTKFMLDGKRHWLGLHRDLKPRAVSSTRPDPESYPSHWTSDEMRESFGAW